MQTCVFSFLLFCNSAFGLALQRRYPASTYQVKDSHSVPSDWTRIGPAPLDHKLDLTIGLEQSQFDELVNNLYQVSDPGHARYGQYLTAEQVNDLVKPTEESSKLVHDWLADNGLSRGLTYSPAGDWIHCQVSVRDAQRLLGTSYSTFRHEDGTVIVRAPEFSLPQQLLRHISSIQPTNSFFRVGPDRSGIRRASPSGIRRASPIRHNNIRRASKAVDPTPIAKVCFEKDVSPTCLRTLYGTINYTPKATNKTFMALCNYLGEVGSRNDAKIFLQKYRPEAVAGATDFKEVSIDNGPIDTGSYNSTQLENGSGQEANMDLQTMLGIAWPVPLTAYTTGGEQPEWIKPSINATNTNEPFLAWAQYMLALPSLPNVVSTSYGDSEGTVSPSYARAVCNSFAQLGARGVSVLFPSGDGGIGGKNCFSKKYNITTFGALFPAGCPFVTAVGGTHKFEPEVVAMTRGYQPGGGFSRYFSGPAYQEKAVADYFALNDDFKQFKGFFNRSNRAYPDISAQSVNFGGFWNGASDPGSGTSASTPAAAAVIALVNDALIAAGKPVLGFLNPWLYQGGGSAFTDITQGVILGCNTTGFPATKGWDLASGWGTPHFPNILSNLGIGSA
ncbi:H(+)/Cl(-) exchange transporter 5 [Venturia nashicola]|uniref:tripeptidyl-peptidase II n=1 Tax=Venturia nashicola TaxID=86259 RepID=A0A4Z1P9J5_9PEZI|nr:H(+)/Cl(-) exchange transporter 5 [Venturia nashicola]